jgi:hypothetical protein
MSIKEKMEKIDKYSDTMQLKIFNFHNFTRFLYNFSTFSLMINEEAACNEKEEEVISQLLAYELSTTFADRIMFPSVKNDFLLKIQEVWKHNFLIPSISPTKIKSITYGNFHELHKQPSSFVYSKHVSSEFKQLAAQINKKLKLDTEKSCGYLKAFLETPGVIRKMYKIARLLVLKNSHLCIVGSPRANGREILQLATLVYPDTKLWEPEVKLANDIMGFKDAFKNALLGWISENKDVVFLYDTNHLDDQLYVDYMANFINLFDKDWIEIFDQEFSEQLIETQKKYMDEESKQIPKIKSIKKLGVALKGLPGISGSHKETFAYENGAKKKELSNSEYYTLAIARISCNFHIVMMVNGLAGYKEMNSFYNFESKMHVLFLEDITNEDSEYFADLTSENLVAAKSNSNLFDISYEYFSKMQMYTPEPKTSQEVYQDNEEENQQNSQRKTRVLAKRMVEIKSKIHNLILDFYEKVTYDDVNEEVIPGLQAGTIPSEDMKLETIAGLVWKGVKLNPKLEVAVSINFNSKFVVFHEMIKFLHDFLSTSLMIRNNYYDSLVEKIKDLSEFYSATVTRKKDLHFKSHELTLKMLDYKDQIDKIDLQLEDIQVAVHNNNERKKTQEMLEIELAKVVSEKERRIRKIVSVIEQTTGADYEYV